MDLTTNGNYNICWTRFDRSTSIVFKDLGVRKEFIDVTLACEDDYQVSAHKFILAASSSFFREILLRNPHPHPVIYLDNVKSDQLEALVTFMYTGETNIKQNQFHEFMVTGRRYKVVGLMEEWVEARREETGRKEQELYKDIKKTEASTIDIIDTMVENDNLIDDGVIEDSGSFLAKNEYDELYNEVEVDRDEVHYIKEVVVEMDDPMGFVMEDKKILPNTDVTHKYGFSNRFHLQ